jgi:hypothetical protein
MLNDVLNGLSAAQARLDERPADWICLGLVDTRDEARLVELALGPTFEVLFEPYEESLALAAGHPAGRGALSYEVWGRRA